MHRWDADYGYLRADYVADYGDEEYGEQKEVIARDTDRKHVRKNFTSFEDETGDNGELLL